MSIPKEKHPSVGLVRFGAAVARLNHWLEGETLLFWAYVLCLSWLLLPHLWIFLSVVLPLVFLKLLHLDTSRPPPEFSATLSSARILRLGKSGISVIFCAAALYQLIISLSSLLQPVTGLQNALLTVVVSIEILCFLFLTGLLVASYKDFIGSFFTVTCVVAALGALTEIIVFLTTAPIPPNMAQYRLGSMELPGDFGATRLSLIYAIFLVACIAMLSRDVRFFWYRIVLAASALILACGVVLTQSRSAYLAVLAGIASTFRWSSRSIRVAVVTVAVIVGVMFAAVPTVRDAMFWRGDSYRLEVWGHYANLAWERPWLGYGRFKNIRFTAKDGLTIPHAHNLILSAQVRGGVLATGAMIVMLFGGLYYTARYAKLTGQAAPLAIMVTITVAGMFDYEILTRGSPDWQWVVFWLPIGISIGTELDVRSGRMKPIVEG